jgi:hypothetical protein
VFVTGQRSTDRSSKTKGLNNMLANLITLGVQLLVLLGIVAFVVSLFSGKPGTAAAGDGSGTVTDEGGKPPFGRWDTPTERDQYFRQRGHSTNWME